MPIDFVHPGVPLLRRCRQIGMMDPVRFYVSNRTRTRTSMLCNEK